MKILFLLPYLPTPPRFGGQRRLHGLMTELARRHEISVLSFVDPAQDQTESLQATRKYCRAVVTVSNRYLAAGGARKRALQLGSLFTRRSFERHIYQLHAMQVALDRLVSDEKFDLVQVEFSHMAVFGFASNGRPRLCLDEHNIEYDVLRRTAGADVGLVRRAYNVIDWRKLRDEERRAWRRFDGCVVTSARDQQLLARDAPDARVGVVPNGVDVDSFSPMEAVPTEPDTVLFFGAINYYPNTEGLLFFLRDVWPRLKALRPSARLRIMGPKPPPIIEAWPDPSVEVVGYVDDVRPNIARAAAIVVPLRIGGGTRLKVLEAMALGKAIVSTTLGAEGIDVQNERDILLADDAAELATQLARVLADPAMGRKLGTAARGLVVERYSWRSAAERLVRFYGELGVS